MFPANNADRGAGSPDCGVQRTINNVGKLYVGVGPVNDENLQNIRIQMAVSRYNCANSSPSYRQFSPSAYRCSVMRPQLPETTSNGDRTDSPSIATIMYSRQRQKVLPSEVPSKPISSFLNSPNSPEKNQYLTYAKQRWTKKSVSQMPQKHSEPSQLESSTAITPEFRYSGPVQFPRCIINKTSDQPTKRHNILAQLKTDAPGLPITRYMDDSAEKYYDLKSTRSVLDVLQDLSRKRIHVKDGPEEHSKRVCKGLGGDYSLDGEAPYKPLFVPKSRQNVFPKRDQMTQTLERHAEQQPNDQTVVRDSKWEIRKKLARKNNEILASLSSSVKVASYLKRRVDEVVPEEKTPTSNKKEKRQKIDAETSMENADSNNPEDSAKKNVRGSKDAASPKSPQSKDRLMSIFFDLQNSSGAKANALKSILDSPGDKQFSRSKEINGSPQSVKTPTVATSATPSKLTDVPSSTGFSFMPSPLTASGSKTADVEKNQTAVLENKTVPTSIAPSALSTSTTSAELSDSNKKPNFSFGLTKTETSPKFEFSTSPKTVKFNMATPEASANTTPSLAKPNEIKSLFSTALGQPDKSETSKLPGEATKQFVPNLTFPSEPKSVSKTSNLDGSLPTLSQSNVSPSSAKLNNSASSPFSFGLPSNKEKPSESSPPEAKKPEEKPAFSFGTTQFSFGAKPSGSDGSIASPTTFSFNAPKPETKPAEFKFSSSKIPSIPSEKATPTTNAATVPFFGVKPEVSKANVSHAPGSEGKPTPGSTWSFGGATTTEKVSSGASIPAASPSIINSDTAGSKTSASSAPGSTLSTNQSSVFSRLGPAANTFTFGAPKIESKTSETEPDGTSSSQKPSVSPFAAMMQNSSKEGAVKKSDSLFATTTTVTESTGSKSDTLFGVDTSKKSDSLFGKSNPPFGTSVKTDTPFGTGTSQNSMTTFGTSALEKTNATSQPSQTQFGVTSSQKTATIFGAVASQKSDSPFGGETATKPEAPFGSVLPQNPNSTFGTTTSGKSDLLFGQKPAEGKQNVGGFNFGQAPNIFGKPSDKPAGTAFGEVASSSIFNNNATTTTTVTTSSTTNSSSTNSTAVFGGFSSNTPMFNQNTQQSQPTTTSAPVFSFGAPKSSTPAPGTTTTPVFAFWGSSSTFKPPEVASTAVTTAQSTPFGQTAPAFGAAATTAQTTSFGHTVPAFGAAATTAQTTPFGQTPSAFSVPATTSQTTVFGQTAPAFGAAATTAQTTAFGQTPSAFSVPTTTAQTTPFGQTSSAFSTAVTTAQTTAFGQTASAFSVPATTAQSSPFGQTQSAFGAAVTTAQTTPFGQTTSAFSAGTFGSSSTPTFGQSASTGSFKPNTTFNPTPLSTNENKFGSNVTSTPAVPASTFAFGKSSTTTNAPYKFGASQSTAFGQNANPPAFGSSQPNAPVLPAFGSATTSANATPSPFGSTTPGVSPFGSTSTAFGSSSGAPGSLTFGSTASSAPASSPFGSSASATPSPFSSSTSSTAAPFQFGAGQTNKPANAGFNFGASSAQPQNSSFSFGSSSTASSGALNFSSNAPTTPAFGAAPSTNLGFNSIQNPGIGGFNQGPSPATPFGQAPTASPAGMNSPFGQAQSPAFSVPGTFSIGSGSAPARSRSRARRKF